MSDPKETIQIPLSMSRKDAARLVNLINQELLPKIEQIDDDGENTVDALLLQYVAVHTASVLRKS